MIRSLKLFADCVESLRTAEKKYEEEPTPFNKAIVESLQKKVDGWIVWVRQQKDSHHSLANPSSRFFTVDFLRKCMTAC